MSNRWNGWDLLIMIVVAFVFSWIFISWDFVYDFLLGTLRLPLWTSSLINGVWFLAGFIGMAMVRKPGACVFTETLAAVLEVAFAHWLLGGYPIDVIGEAYTHVYAVTPMQLPHGVALGQTGDGRFMYEFGVPNMVAFVGLLEGLGPEVVFGFGLYRKWSLPLWLAAGAAGALLEWFTGIYVTQYYLYLGPAETFLTMASSLVGISLVAGGIGYAIARRHREEQPSTT